MLFDLPDGVIDDMLELVEYSTGPGELLSDKGLKLVESVVNKCKLTEVTDKLKKYSEVYDKDLKAEDIWRDILVKIAEAPTQLHWINTIVYLMPILHKHMIEEMGAVSVGAGR